MTKNGRSAFAESLAILKRDKRLAPLIKKYGPPEFKKYFGKIDVFEALLRSIIYQQLSGYAAAAIHKRVTGLFPGNKPTAAGLLKIRAPRLRKAGLSVQKINYVRDLARKSLDGTIDSRKFARMSSEEIVEHLVQVKGVGTWTGHMILIFTLQRKDILPTGDLGIRKGFQIAYRMRTLPDHAAMERLANPWREVASVAAWYLWRVADSARPTPLKKGKAKPAKATLR
jgi:DNA-3-methyladenine glycosylase II